MEKISILIVEDEAIVSMDLKMRLTQAGFQVVGTAASGKQALDIFTQSTPDLVLMDINIKGEWDGIETVEKMAILRPIPIIYLTAQTDVPTFDRAKNTQPAAYLTKPFDEKNLQLAIELAIHNFAVQKTPPVTEGVLSSDWKDKKTDMEASKTPTSTNADNILKTENAIFIKQNYRFVKFQPEDLLFIQADGAYTDLITLKHKYSLRLTLSQALDRLQLSKLVRVHRSFAVNLSRIEQFNDVEISIGQHVIPIGTSFKEGFLRQFDFL